MSAHSAISESGHLSDEAAAALWQIIPCFPPVGGSSNWNGLMLAFCLSAVTGTPISPSLVQRAILEHFAVDVFDQTALDSVLPPGPLSPQDVERLPGFSLPRAIAAEFAGSTDPRANTDPASLAFNPDAP
jgi:hypothetical protein